MTYPCTICTKCFLSSTALQQHMSSPTHVHLCTYDNCGRSFISKQALQQHMRLTSHIPPLSCRTCAKTFGSLEALDQHQNSTAHNGQSKQVSSTGFKKENVQQESSRPPVRPVPHTRNKSCVGQLGLQRHAKPVIYASVECSICKRSSLVLLKNQNIIFLF